tara:strand:- start:2317 stop:3315 length:999 start_codon:yes stop_codon:yes gene_type:complete
MVQLGFIKNKYAIIGLIFLFACTNTNNKVNKKNTPVASIQKLPTPSFDADSAYAYIKNQVEFGPRVPNSIAHQNCYNYLVQNLERFGAAVLTQNDIVERYDGTKMQMKNIIGSFNQNNHKRILLCAHWDSRFIADNDIKDMDKPILGANDGGSGVGVLLEIARQISLNPLNLGVDIIFFDVEDQGQPNTEINPRADTWCLGSQYWAMNPHVENYFADYGILLDMVGGKNATFTKEGVSVQFGERIVERVWSAAEGLGFANFFVSKKTPPIIDDHLYINTLIHIPTINIVEYNQNTHNRFNAHHHKHSDNMDIINSSTLKAVGQTVLEVLYTE